MMQEIKENNLTFVFQGPETLVSGVNVTLASIKSTRELFPKAQIIFSTWYGIDSSIYQGLNVRILTSDDPGSVMRDSINKIFLNINRQITSSSVGIDAVTTEYAIKIRSDLIPVNRNILALLNSTDVLLPRNPTYSHLSKRLIVLDVTSIDPRLREPLPFHPCDWVYAGLTSDLKQMFPLGATCDETAIGTYYNCIEKPLNNPFPTSMARYHPECWIFVNAMRSFHQIDFDHLSDVSEGNIDLSQLLIFNNLLIVSMKAAGLKSLKHRISLSNYTRTYSTNSWRKLQGEPGSSGTKVLNLRFLIAIFVLNLQQQQNLLKRVVLKIKKYVS